MDAEKKQCCACKELKPLSEFNRGTGKQGKNAKCRECSRLANIAWREAHPDYWRNGPKPSPESRIAIRRKCERAQRKKFPEKFRARSKLKRAVREGKIHKPDICSQCGLPGETNGHHADYSKPLDVIWLCRACHDLTHKDA